jgi:hypothetical protein
MGATLATVAAICKEIYEPRVRKQLNDEAKTLKRIQRSSDGVESNVGGRYVTFPIQTRRNAGIGARNELEALPAAGQQGYTSARVGLKYLYGRINLSGPTIKLVDTNAQAFASALDREVNGIKTDLAKDQNRQVYGDGSGAVAVLVTGAAANTQTVLNTQYLQLGEVIDIIDGTTLGNPTPTVKASNRNVTAINVATNQFTFDGATQAVVNGDIVVRTGNVNREWTGFAKIVANTGTLYNVDPTVEGTWKAEVDSNSGVNRALSEGLMILMADRVYTNGGKTTAIYGNLGVRRAYFNLLSQQRMYSGSSRDFGGGFTGLSFTTDNGDIPFFTDIDAPPNTLYFLNEDEFTLFREEDWSFADMDGSMWQRVIGFDAYEAFLYQYSELGCHRRNSQGVIKDITEG